MKNIKTFEGFENLDRIVIDSDPYDISQFGQNKYGVYIESNGNIYYIGDIRKFKGSGEYISYLNIDKIVKKSPNGSLILPNDEQMHIINSELDKNYLSRNLMDDTISYREFLKNKGINL